MIFQLCSPRTRKCTNSLRRSSLRTNLPISVKEIAMKSYMPYIIPSFLPTESGSWLWARMTCRRNFENAAFCEDTWIEKTGS
jgi:hypothetical protein